MYILWIKMLKYQTTLLNFSQCHSSLLDIIWIHVFITAFPICAIMEKKSHIMQCNKALYVTQR